MVHSHADRAVSISQTVYFNQFLRESQSNQAAQDSLSSYPHSFDVAVPSCHPYVLLVLYSGRDWHDGRRKVVNAKFLESNAREHRSRHVGFPFGLVVSIRTWLAVVCLYLRWPSFHKNENYLSVYYMTIRACL